MKCELLFEASLPGILEQARTTTYHLHQMAHLQRVSAGGAMAAGWRSAVAENLVQHPRQGGKHRPMDTDRFDALTRKLFTGPSRRGLLRASLGSMVALAGVAEPGLPVADARKRKRKKKNKNKNKSEPNVPPAPIPPVPPIVIDEPGCGSGQTRCGNECRDLQRDADNCGSCNLLCDASNVCVNGICTCPPGQADCGEGCVDINSNQVNCGACGNTCSSGQICGGGFCLTRCDNPSSSIPFFSCPADPGGVCVAVDGEGVCIILDPGNVSCVPFARESCDGAPCPDGRICANFECGASPFRCVLPAQSTA